ncbi:MAG: SCO family protein [Granulosicoccus sp.]|nr:SCO family protein [Granulosicoccus sp.]
MSSLRHSLCCLLLVPGFVWGHAGETHEDKGVSVDSTAVPTNNAPLPIEVGGPFSLIDHHGNNVTDQTFIGKHMLVFFGYTDCQIMCSISLDRIGGALALLQDENTGLLDKLAPLVVTVDPHNDTPDKLKNSLAKYHSALLGLTGTSENLDKIYQAYNQSPSVIDGKLNEKDVVTHTSYFYLMGPDGELQTFFPPILNAQSMASILKKYIL